jgi:hypothetical protein
MSGGPRAAVSPAAGLNVVTHRWPGVIGPIRMSFSPMIEQCSFEYTTTATLCCIDVACIDSYIALASHIVCNKIIHELVCFVSKS